MDKFEQLFAEYPFTLTDELVKKNTADILAQHTAENNTREVWMQCLHQIDLTTLNGDDTTEKVATMAERVNDFDGHFPGVPNVAAMCVYPALVETARDVLTEPIGIAAVAAGFPASQTFIEVKVAEAAMAVAAGATEIDIVISIGKFLEGNYQEVFDEISEIKAAIRPGSWHDPWWRSCLWSFPRPLRRLPELPSGRRLPSELPEREPWHPAWSARPG